MSGIIANGAAVHPLPITHCISVGVPFDKFRTGINGPVGLGSIGDGL